VLLTNLGKLPEGPQRRALIAALQASLAAALQEQVALERKLLAQWTWLWETPEDDHLYGHREDIWQSTLAAYERLCDVIGLAQDTVTGNEGSASCPF
jgi:hypothetical protein